MVIIDGCETGIENFLDEQGCTISDWISECAEGAKNHGSFMSCVDHLTNTLKKDGVITGRENGKIDRCADKADIP